MLRVIRVLGTCPWKPHELAFASAWLPSGTGTLTSVTSVATASDDLERSLLLVAVNANWSEHAGEDLGISLKS